MVYFRQFVHGNSQGLVPAQATLLLDFPTVKESPWRCCTFHGLVRERKKEKKEHNEKKERKERKESKER